MRTGNTRKEERVVREHNKIEEHEHNTIGTHRVASYSCPAAHHREDGEKHAEARHSREECGQAVVVFLSNPSPKKNVGSLNNQEKTTLTANGDARSASHRLNALAQTTRAVVSATAMSVCKAYLVTSRFLSVMSLELDTNGDYVFLHFHESACYLNLV